MEQCKEYSKKWLVKNNLKKSVILNCGIKMFKDEEINIIMEGKRIPVVKES